MYIFMALVTSLVGLFYCCVTADILTKLLQQCFLIFIVVPWLYLGNSQVSVYRTIGPTLVIMYRRGDHLGHATRMPRTNFRSHYPRRLHIKFGFDRASGFGEEDV